MHTQFPGLPTEHGGKFLDAVVLRQGFPLHILQNVTLAASSEKSVTW